MIKSKLLGILIAAVLFLPAMSFAEEIGEDEIVSDGSQQIYIDEEDEYSFFARGRFTNMLAVSFGLDNNTHLDPTRNADCFNQILFKTNFTSPITRDKRVSGILGYELMSLLYTEESSLNIIKNTLSADIDNKINKEWELSGGYRLDTYSYINSASDNFYENAGHIELKENLPLKMYHKLGYELGYKNYPGRHTRTVTDIGEILDSDKKRNDLRNTFDYEIGRYFPNDLFKLGYQFYNNNSTDKFINFYDYNSYKLSASLTHLFNDKLFGFMTFARQYRAYRSRSITLDPATKENDKTYLLSTALYYNLNTSLTLGCSYTYRQNVSNDPLQNYSGSLVSVSSYYRF
jgi:hypothetical protein